MLTFAKPKHRGVEQLVARRAHNPEAGGSSPSPATKIDNWLFYSRLFFVFLAICSRIAQSRHRRRLNNFHFGVGKFP